jgi:hypothetical protein
MLLCWSKNIKTKCSALKKKKKRLVAHACNPSYTGGRNQEDGSLKAALGKYSRDPISEMPNTQKNRARARGVAQVEGQV